jgi:hypothetical protein
MELKAKGFEFFWQRESSIGYGIYSSDRRRRPMVGRAFPVSPTLRIGARFARVWAAFELCVWSAYRERVSDRG